MSAILKERKRLRLQTLARALTEINNLLVRFGSGFHTDLTAITARDMDQEESIVPGVPASKAERWVAMKAGCAHEAGHILFTDKKAWEKAVSRGPLFQSVVNILEDARIERATANAYPGTLLWFRFANEYVTRNRPDWGRGVKAFLNGLCAYAVAGVVPSALDRGERDLINKCRPFVDRARVSGDTRGVLRQAEEILKLAEAAYPEASVPPPPPMPGTSSPRPAERGPLDPRRVKPEESEPASEEPEEPEEIPEGPDAESEPDEELEDPEWGKSSGEPDPDEPNPEPDEPDPEPLNPDEGGTPEEPETPRDADPEHADEPDSGRDDTERQPGEDDPGSDDETGFGGDAAEPDRSGPDEDSSSEEPDTSGGSGSDGEPEEDTPDDPPDDSPAESVPEEDALPEPEEEPVRDPELEELLESAEDELSRIENGAEREGKLREREAVPEVDFGRIEEDLARDIHRGVRLEIRELRPDPGAYRDLVGSQAGLIRRLADEIKKALEYRRSVPRRALKKGRLDPGALWKVRIPDPGVFLQVEEPGNTPALAVYLLVDCSGSMAGPRIEAARTAAAVLHEACVALRMEHCVTGFTSFGTPVTHLRAVKWGEPDGSGVASLNAHAGNRDGYSVRVAARELNARPEPQKLLIVLSDGMPADDFAYQRRVAFADTARAVREAEKAGIGVIGIYFGDERDLPGARMIYNNLIYAQRLEHLPAILGRVLKKTLTSRGA